MKAALLRKEHAAMYKPVKKGAHPWISIHDERPRSTKKYTAHKPLSSGIRLSHRALEYKADVIFMKNPIFIKKHLTFPLMEGLNYV